MLTGAGQPLPGDKTGDFHAELDDAAAHNVNYCRLWNIAVWDGSNEYYPWLRVGPRTAVDGLPVFDLTQWDANYWSRLTACIEYARINNIYVSVLLYEQGGMQKPDAAHRWDWNPWNPLNNINGLSLPTTGAGIPAFYNLSDPKLLGMQELYVAKMIQETSGFPNVIYEVCNEYSGSFAWEQHWVDFIKARCSNIVSVNHLGQTSSTPSAVWTYPNIDLVKLHWGTVSPATTDSNMVATYFHNKATSYDETPEFAAITDVNYRNMLWSAFVGGGHAHLENGNNPDLAFQAVQFCRNFIDGNTVHFWQMSPNNSLVTRTPGGNAYTLAKPGSEYVVYIVGTSGTMTMSLTPGVNYTAQAYDPSTGKYTNLNVNGNTISGIPGYISDIVIYVKAVSP